MYYIDINIVVEIFISARGLIRLLAEIIIKLYPNSRAKLTTGQENICYQIF